MTKRSPYRSAAELRQAIANGEISQPSWLGEDPTPEWERAWADGEMPVVDLGPFKVVRWARARVNDPALPYALEIVLDNAAGARFVELRVITRPDGDQITADGLRALPVGQLKRTVADEASFEMADRGRGYGGPLSGQERSAYLRARKRAEAKGRRRLTDDDLRRVADVYRVALVDGEAPTAAVQRALRLNSRAQAGRWVSKAREAGFLGESPGRGKKGEQR